MTLDVRVNGYSIRDLLDAPPSISDEINAVCRILEIRLKKDASLKVDLGKRNPIELWYKGKRWYYGYLFRKGYTSNGVEKWKAYDPLIYLRREKDDYYLKNSTATQGLQQLARKVGIPMGRMANTAVVLPPLYYQGADGDRIGVDLLARTYNANRRKYWYRFNPDVEGFGLTLFERTVPSTIWAFQVGINLEYAEHEESIEETVTVVRLVNRETGKVVTRQRDTDKYGRLVHFEEVDKDGNASQEAQAQQLLDKLAKINLSSQIDGINPYGSMPQFFSGDVIYVEEQHTGLIGAYHIKNIKQTFESDELVRLAMDIQTAPDIPEVEYEGATERPGTR